MNRGRVFLQLATVFVMMVAPLAFIALADTLLLKIAAWVLWFGWCQFLILRGHSSNVGIFLAVLAAAIYLTLLPEGRLWAYAVGVVQVSALHTAYRSRLLDPADVSLAV
jgi:hypothetical protein